MSRYKYHILRNLHEGDGRTLCKIHAASIVAYVEDRSAYSESADILWCKACVKKLTPLERLAGAEL